MYVLSSLHKSLPIEHCFEDCLPYLAHSRVLALGVPRSPISSLDRTVLEDCLVLLLDLVSLSQVYLGVSPLLRKIRRASFLL